MLQIGDFSKLTQVSVKTLRYYDSIGLLKPVHVDQFTNFRYYAVEQLPRLNRIIALKEIGFSLEQIGHLIDNDLNAEQIKGMLKLRQAEAEQSIQEEMARLARIQARLEQIEREGQPSSYDVIVKPVEATPIVSVRRVVTNYAGVGQLFGELMQAKKQVSGPGIAIYHDVDYKETDPDVEVGMEARKPVPGLDFREMDPATMASTIHTGSYETLSSGYLALMDWIESNAYQIAGPNRNIYLESFQKDRPPEQFITEIQIPIEPKERNP